MIHGDSVGPRPWPPCYLRSRGVDSGTCPARVTYPTHLLALVLKRTFVPASSVHAVTLPSQRDCLLGHLHATSF